MENNKNTNKDTNKDTNNELLLLYKLAEESSNCSKDYDNYKERQKNASNKSKSDVKTIFSKNQEITKRIINNIGNEENDNVSIVVEDEDDENEGNKSVKLGEAKPKTENENAKEDEEEELPNDFIEDVIHYVGYMKIVEKK